jgi:hypothetical protein
VILSTSNLFIVNVAIDAVALEVSHQLAVVTRHVTSGLVVVVGLV